MKEEQTQSKSSEPTKEDTIKPSPIVRTRKWLERNKVFFDTIAALLLSAMAVTISIVQVVDSRRDRFIQETARWGELRNAMWTIVDLFQPSTHGISIVGKEVESSIYETLIVLSKDEMVILLKDALKTLDSQISNPVLIQSRECLGYWRNAISTARIHSDMIQKGDRKWQQDKFVKALTSISKDVMFVWDKIILESDQVSATGGRPETNK